MSLLFRVALMLSGLAVALPALAQPGPAGPSILLGVSEAGARLPGGASPAGFVAEWTRLLTERGATVKLAKGVPAADPFDHADVLVLQASLASEWGEWGESGGRRVERFLKRGGGLVVLLNSGLPGVPRWLERLLGATASPVSTEPEPGLAGFCVALEQHPITRGVADFDLPHRPVAQFRVQTARVLGRAVLSDNLVVPCLWVRDQARGRVGVLQVGPGDAGLQVPSLRHLLLRSIAWAGHRAADSLLEPADLASLRFPRGEPSAPEAAAKKIRVSPGFVLSLAAAEPVLTRPMSVDWDARGRMWVLARQSREGGPPWRGPGLSILILGEVDGQGRARAAQVFADCPARATSFVFHRDGVIVSAGAEVLFLRDTDGDGRADRTEVLFRPAAGTGAGSGLSQLRWGLDGWIYGCLRSGEGSALLNMAGVQGARLFPVSTGLVRFQADGSMMEQVAATGGHPSGFDFSWDGELFFSRGSGGSHLSYGVMSERFLTGGRLGDAAGFMSIEDHTSVSPLPSDPPLAYSPVAVGVTFASAAGGTFYNGGAWPEKFAGSFFLCESGAHLVHEDLLSRAESLAFEATRRSEAEFLASGDPWFRPVQVRVGPDGALYVVDEYADTGVHAAAGGDRDRDFGRVWRVQHHQARLQEMVLLERAAPAALAGALTHPNAWVRRTAARLLMERKPEAARPVLEGLLRSRLPLARVEALWALHLTGLLGEASLLMALGDAHPAVANNALRIIPELRAAPSTNVLAAAVRLARETDERTRLDALIALSWWTPDQATVQALHKMFPDVKEGLGRSAILNAASHAPEAFIRAAFRSDRADAYQPLVVRLMERAVARKDAQLCAWILEFAAGEASGSDRLKIAVLQTCHRTAGQFLPPASADLVRAWHTLLQSTNRAVKVAAYPVVQQYQPRHDALLGADLEQVRKALLAELSREKLKDDERIALVPAVLALPELRAEAVRRLDSWLAAGVAKDVQKQIITGLAGSADQASGAALIRNFGRLDPENRPRALAVLVRRREWALALLRAVADQSIAFDELGVVATGQLLAHASPEVSRKAAAVLGRLRGIEPRGRDAILALFRPAVEHPADLKNGQKLFERHCMVCHKFGDKGSDLGPNLTGAGYRGRAALLTHILDPNRELDSRFALCRVLTRKGENYSGLIKSRSDLKVVLRNSEGEVELLPAEIESITSSGLSLMPERLEWLGETNLRDIVAYLAANVPKGFRPLDLSGAFTADSRKGLYAVESDAPSLVFKRYGILMMDGIPFDIVNPASTADGLNVVVLRGGRGFARTLPRRVVFPVGTSARRIHVLGGVAGWGFPEGAPETQGMPAAKATLEYADGTREEIVWRNGEEFTGCAQPFDVPGSKSASDLVSTGQLRIFSMAPGRKAVIRQILLESFDNQLAPTFVALTAQVE